MVSLQAALPNIAPSSNLGTLQHVSSLPTQSPSYASAISPSIALSFIFYFFVLVA